MGFYYSTSVSFAPRQSRGSVRVRHLFSRSGLRHYQSLQPGGAKDLQLRHPKAWTIYRRQRQFWLGWMQWQHQLWHKICKGLRRCSRKNGERCSRTDESAQQSVWADGEQQPPSMLSSIRFKRCRLEEKMNDKNRFSSIYLLIYNRHS